LEQAKSLFDQVYVVDQQSDNPEQYRAIGWCGANLYSIVFEVRFDSDGEY